MGQEVATTALPSELQVCHRTTLCSDLGCCREVDKLIFLGATIVLAIRLDKLQILSPFAGDRQIAGVATNGEWEIHVRLSCYPREYPFFYGVTQ